MHSLGAPTWHSLPRITRGPDTCLSFLHAHSTKTSSLVSSTPTHTHLARSAWGPDHGLRPSYFLLLPASTAPCPKHFQAKALGGLTGTNRAARTHLFSTSHAHRTLSANSHAFSSYSNVFSELSNRLDPCNDLRRLANDASGPAPGYTSQPTINTQFQKKGMQRTKNVHEQAEKQTTEPYSEKK
jgi:hypothetical protein